MSHGDCDMGYVMRIDIQLSSKYIYIDSGLVQVSLPISW